MNFFVLLLGRRFFRGFTADDGLSWRQLLVGEVAVCRWKFIGGSGVVGGNMGWPDGVEEGDSFLL